MEKIKELLRTDADLGFLLKLGGKELEDLKSLPVKMRARVDSVNRERLRTKWGSAQEFSDITEIRTLPIIGISQAGK